MKTKQEEFLNEDKLGTYLSEIYPNLSWVRDKKFLQYSFRPDYVNHEQKLLLEFDGYLHYTKASTIKRDQYKDSVCKSLGYTVIRIPYFVQMSSDVISHLFLVECDVTQTYPHGFISDKSSLVLPCDYCELGIQRFMKDLDRFYYIKNDILESLKIKKEKLGSWDLVLPPVLQKELGLEI